MYKIYLTQHSRSGQKENVVFLLTDEQVRGRMDGNYLGHLARYLDDQMYSHCGWLAEDRHWECVYYPEPPPYEYVGEDPDTEWL